MNTSYGSSSLPIFVKTGGDTISNNSQNKLTSSLHGLGWIIAFVVAIFLTPTLYELTSGWVLSTFEDTYGYRWKSLADIGLWATCAFTIFFLVRAILIVSTALILIRFA